MSLRDRCNQFLQSIERGMLPDPDELQAFVQSEIGRAADPSLEDTKPIVLYFADEEGRDAMVQLMKAFKPGMISKRWPR
jgi:hypothetical protein